MTDHARAIISIAVLLRTAFALRDEEAMVALLRQLSRAVEAMEAEQELESEQEIDPDFMTADHVPSRELAAIMRARARS